MFGLLLGVEELHSRAINDTARWYLIIVHLQQQLKWFSRVWSNIDWKCHIFWKYKFLQINKIHHDHEYWRYLDCYVVVLPLLQLPMLRELDPRSIQSDLLWCHYKLHPGQYRSRWGIRTPSCDEYEQGYPDQCVAEPTYTRKKWVKYFKILELYSHSWPNCDNYKVKL